MEAAENGCTCWGVWRRVQFVRKGDTIRIQGYAKGDNGKLAKVLWTDGDYVMVRRLDTKLRLIFFVSNARKFLSADSSTERA